MKRTTQPPGKPQPSQSAAAVADSLGIPLHVCDVQATFYRDIVQPFIAEYAQGRTPNPCVLCNPGLKFATLVEQADRLNAQWIATGHYARIEHPSAGPARLLQAADRRKDQSYALYRLTQRHLSRLLLPLGDIEDKSIVRDLARERNLPSAEQRRKPGLVLYARRRLPVAAGDAEAGGHPPRPHRQRSRGTAWRAHRSRTLHRRAAQRTGYRGSRTPLRAAAAPRRQRPHRWATVEPGTPHVHHRCHHLHVGRTTCDDIQRQRPHPLPRSTGRRRRSPHR